MTRQGREPKGHPGHVCCGYCGFRGHNARTCPESGQLSRRQEKVRQLFDEICGYAKAFDPKGIAMVRVELRHLQETEREHSKCHHIKSTE